MSPNAQMLFIQFGFAAALLPMLSHKEHKPEFLSALWTAGLGLWMAIVLLDVGLWAGALAAGIVCVFWLVLAYQRYRLNKEAGVPLIKIPYWLPYFFRYFM